MDDNILVIIGLITIAVVWIGFQLMQANEVINRAYLLDAWQTHDEWNKGLDECPVMDNPKQDTRQIQKRSTG